MCVYATLLRCFSEVENKKINTIRTLVLGTPCTQLEFPFNHEG